VRWRTLRRVKLCALARAEGVSDTRGPGGAPNLSTTRRARLQARAISGACDFWRARLQARAWRRSLPRMAIVTAQRKQAISASARVCALSSRAIATP